MTKKDRDELIIGDYNDGWDALRLAPMYGLSQRTVQRVIKKYKEDQERVRQEISAVAVHGDWEDSVKQICDENPYKLNPLQNQVDGDHYKKLKIQPVEYIHANNIGFSEGNAITYLTRWRDKGGIKDLEKAIHTIQLLIELEKDKAE